MCFLSYVLLWSVKKSVKKTEAMGRQKTLLPPKQLASYFWFIFVVLPGFFKKYIVWLTALMDSTCCLLSLNICQIDWGSVGDVKFSGRLKIYWSTNLEYCSQ